eukprot:12885280-Prorocentrum_lima.AAC.1
MVSDNLSLSPELAVRCQRQAAAMAPLKAGLLKHPRVKPENKVFFADMFVTGALLYGAAIWPKLTKGQKT